MAKKRIASALLTAMLAGIVIPQVGAIAMASAAQMPNISEGYYMYETGSSKSGFALRMTVKKVQSGKIICTLDQSRWYPPAGGYITSSRTIKAKVKNNKSTCKFKSFGGDTCKAQIKIISNKKVKIKVDTLKAGHEWHPLGTGGEWKTLKRAKTGLD